MKNLDFKTKRMQHPPKNKTPQNKFLNIKKELSCIKFLWSQYRPEKGGGSLRDAPKQRRKEMKERKSMIDLPASDWVRTQRNGQKLDNTQKTFHPSKKMPT